MMLSISGMDACKASNCYHGVRNAPWMEVAGIHLVKATKQVQDLEGPTVAMAAALALPAARTAPVSVAPARRRPGEHPRRWRSWISSPQRRPTRQSTPSTNELSPLSTMSLNIFNIDFPRTGNSIFHTLFVYQTKNFDFFVH